VLIQYIHNPPDRGQELLSTEHNKKTHWLRHQVYIPPPVRGLHTPTMEHPLTSTIIADLWIFFKYIFNVHIQLLSPAVAGGVRLVF